MTSVNDSASLLAQPQTAYVGTYDVVDPATSYDTIYAQRYAADNSAIGDPIMVTSPYVSATAISTLVLSNGGFVVTYNLVDPHNVDDYYPLNYLAQSEFSASDQNIGDKILSLNDYNISVNYSDIALSGGAYSYVMEVYEDDQGDFIHRKTLGFVDATGKVTTTNLYSSAHGDAPFPFIVQGDAVLKHYADNSFAVSWTTEYTPPDPEYPTPTPTPQGDAHYTRIYDDSGHLKESFTFDFGVVPTLDTLGQNVTKTQAEFEVYQRIIVDEQHPGSQVELTIAGPGTVDFASKLENERSAIVHASNDGNTITTGQGYDYLYGGNGNDYLNGGDGGGVIDGGEGNDVLRSGSGDDYIRDINENTPGVEQVKIYAGGGDDNILVGSPNGITGSINGGDGHDVLHLQDTNSLGSLLTIGVEVLETGLQNTISGSVAQFESFQRIVVADQSFPEYGDPDYNTYTVALRLTGAGTLDLRPQLENERAAFVFASDSGNTIITGNYDDYLYSGAGHDRLIGGGGNDTYVIDSRADQVIELAGQGIDRVISSDSYTLVSNVENLQLSGSSNISGTGNGLDNSLFGNAGNNHLVGLDGNDRLDGAGGTDYLQGGAGADTFVFSTSISTKWNSDLIADFTPGSDHIELSSMVYVGLGIGQLASSAFQDQQSPGNVETADTRIIYDAGGHLFFDEDGSGSKQAHQFATLADRPHLTAADFMIA